MAFLFKSKKQEREKARERDANGSQGSVQGARDSGGKNEKGSLQRSTPTGSLNSFDTDMHSGSPDQGYARRGPTADQQPPQQQPPQQPPPQQQSDLPFRNVPAASNAPNPNASLYPWSQRRLLYTSSHPSPFPRYGAAVNSVASKEGDVYIMGGLINGATVKGDLWLIEAGGNMSCYPLPTTSEGPGPRVGHSSLLVGNAFIVFGGDTKIEESDVLDETLYLLNTSTRQWSRVLPSGTRPAGRYGHSLNIVGSKIFIFGGQVEGYFMNDLCAFDLNQLQMTNNRWEMLVPNGESGPDPVPQARTNHTMITFNDKLYLFGGTNGYQWFNDVWCYDPAVNKWSQLDCIGYIPAAREGQAASLVDDVMYVFGGRTEEGNDLGDLAAFRISSRRWYTFQNMGPSPSPRSGHSMTTVGKSVVVVGGEPSSPAGSSTDLGVVYLLDTSKIRYPTDAPSGGASQKVQQARRPSTGDQALQSAPRQGPSRDTAMSPSDGKRPPISAATIPGGQSNGTRSPQIGPDMNGRHPRGPMGPPPQGPPPSKPIPSTVPRSRGQSTERDGVASNHAAAMHSPTSPEPRRPVDSPVSNGRRTPTQPHKSSSIRSETGPAEVSKGKTKHRSQGSIDSAMETVARIAPNRPASPPPPTRQLSNHLNRRSSGRNSQTVAMLKELDTARNRNAWYASELELARKQGYTPSTNLSPVFEGRSESFDDDDRPLIEALLAMKTELANVQTSVDKQAIIAAKQIAEAEKQRDAAVQEAVYAKAKLAGGALQSVGKEDGERADGLNKKLASALGHQKDLQAQMEMLKSQLEAERRARELADDTSNASQKRMEELESYKQQTATELERLRSELHLAQREVREQAAAAADALATTNVLQAERSEMESKYNDAVDGSNDRSQALESLRAAVAASAGTAALLEEKLQSERGQREEAELKYNKLKTEHEESTAELVASTQRLRDAEELAEKNALEAKASREAVLAGLDKVVASDGSKSSKGNSESITTLQKQVTAANALAKKYQEEVDAAAEKLRAAEERIAGLEVYQEQASRDGVSIRRQLQTALRDTQSLQASNSDLKRELASQQLETNAVAVQHNTLKEILAERGISPTASKAKSLGSPRAGSPEQARIRDLEKQLAAATSSHEESHNSMVAALQSSEAQYRDKLAQLEQDYNSAIAYLKTTEKMLKKLKEEHSAYKTENKRLRAEVEDLEDRAAGMGSKEAPDGWMSERSTLQKQIEALQEEVRETSNQLEARLESVTTDLQSTKSERDGATKSAEEVARKLEASKKDLEELQEENHLLEQRAQDAEQRVTLLLDQVGNSVGNYRRQSRQVLPMGGTNGGGISVSHARNESSESEGGYDSRALDARNSTALDNLANELETLRSHWETTNKNYRLSNAFDFDQGAGPGPAKKDESGGLSESLSDWRKRLDAEEKRGGKGSGERS